MKKIFTVLFVLSISFSQGQIIYTDFSPDIYLTNQPPGNLDSVAIDIDQDGSHDFFAVCKTYFYQVHLNCCYFYEDYIQVDPAVFSFTFDSLFVSDSACGLIALDNNMLIGPNFYYPNFYSKTFFYAFSTSFYCGWAFDSSFSKYFPFRKTILNNNYYGWIRIESHPYYMIIYDAAINTIPNDPILSGQTTGQDDIKLNNSIQVYPNPFSTELNITSLNYQLNEITIFDIAGRTLLTYGVPSNFKINTEQLEKGAYVYEIRSHNAVVKRATILKE